MSAEPPWTIGRLLQWTTDYFKAHHSSSPRLDAEVLLAASCGCDRIHLYTTYDQVASEPVRTRFREFVRRRAAGEPVAYLVGHREFYSLSFRVTPAVLIPRPETELLVIAVLDFARAAPRDPMRIVDVGTGSGVIALSVARHLPGSQITAIDISPEALEVARQNAAALHLADQVCFLQGDLLSSLSPEPQFDIVVSNPPYVSEAELRQLAPEIRNYEPHGALVAGPTGAEVIERLIPQAAERLVAGGRIFVEVSPMIAPRVQSLVDNEGRFRETALVKDLAGLPRVLTACRSRLPDGA